MHDGLRIAIICGYFDWFSGYQETALAVAFARLGTTEVVASDRVSPIFSDDHLAAIGRARRYPVGRTFENGVTVTRLPVRELRSMVWSTRATEVLSRDPFDLIIQVMPGQAFSAAGSLLRTDARRVALYGDNSAMWSHLSPLQRRAKAIAFSVSKGLVYRFVNKRADRIFGYTPETADRLDRFRGGKEIEVLPLVYDRSIFAYDEVLRTKVRGDLGYASSDVVVVAAGKFEYKKRIDLLVDAWVSFAAADSRLRLLCVGMNNDSSLNSFRRRITGGGVSTNRFRSVGFVDSKTLNELFNAADVGAWPRMPAITIQQAMGTGLPVVLPRNDWVGHLLRPGAGEYFDVVGEEDVNGMADALGRALAIANPLDHAKRRERESTNLWLSADAAARFLLGTLDAMA